MVWLLLAALLIWLVASSSKKRGPTPDELAANKHEAEAQNEELTRFRHQVDKFTTYEFDFPKMLLKNSAYSLGHMPLIERSYSVRRVDSTHWQVRRTVASVASEIACLNHQIESDPKSKSWH